MKKVLVALLVALSMTQVASALIGGPTGNQKLFGPGGTLVSCNSNQEAYIGSNGAVSCTQKGMLGSSKKSVVGRISLSKLVGPGGKQIKCKAGQEIYVGQNGYTSCIKKGTKGAYSRS